MLLDASTIDDGAVLRPDICVIGAGPAGITLGLELTDGPLDVCILESGQAPPLTTPQDLAAGENADQRYYRIAGTRMRGFGGTSQHWLHSAGMRSRPLDAIDLEPRPEIGRIGWPFSRDDLEPYYHRASRICGLPIYDYAVERWTDPQAGLLPLELPAGAEIVDTIFQIAELGQFVGRQRDLSSAKNVRVLLNSTVLEVVAPGDGGQVEHVTVANGDRRFTVAPKVVVMATGGIENARLLLLSGRHQRHGLGNANGLVGRHFMEHLQVRTGVLRPFTEELSRRLGLYRERVMNDVRVMSKFRPTDAWLRRERLLGSAWTLLPTSEPLITPAAEALIDLREMVTVFRRPLPGTVRRVRTVVTNPRRAAQALLSAKSRDISQEPLFWLAVMSEQEPNPESRVSLGGRRDRFGQRLAKVDWRCTERDLRSIAASQELLDRSFQEAGIGRIEGRFDPKGDRTLLRAGFHHMGTTRMHSDPAQGVVDANSQVHGMSNLYVTGSSVFPTGGYANPTLTVVAMAVRLADHLKQHGPERIRVTKTAMMGSPPSERPMAEPLRTKDPADAPEEET
jgi:choline dehydrogenase-like flavoprotein